MDPTETPECVSAELLGAAWVFFLVWRGVLLSIIHASMLPSSTMDKLDGEVRVDSKLLARC